MTYSFQLAAMVLLYASSHRQDNTYHGLCYTSRGALAGTTNSSPNVFFPSSSLAFLCDGPKTLTKYRHIIQVIARFDTTFIRALKNNNINSSVGLVCIFNSSVRFSIRIWRADWYFLQHYTHTHTHTHTQRERERERERERDAHSDLCT